MKISITVMAHPSRKKYAQRLFNKLILQGFYAVSISYDLQNDEWSNGVNALRNHPDSDWHIVIQDDAVISPNFCTSVMNAIESVPSESIISFYTGKVRPHPTLIKQAIYNAIADEASWLMGNMLYWGVCICIPVSHIEPMLEFVKRYSLKYDNRIGWYYRKTRMPVYYTYPSIVNHNHRIGSLIGNDYDKEPRVAHKFVSDVVKFNDRVVKI